MSALVCHRHRVGCGACARRPDHAGSGRAFRPALIVNPIRPIRRATVRHRVCPRQQTGGQLCVSPTCSHQSVAIDGQRMPGRHDEVVDEHHTRHADADVVERNRRVGAQPYVMPPAPARLRLPRRVCASTASERQRAQPSISPWRASSRGAAAAGTHPLSTSLKDVGAIAARYRDLLDAVHADMQYLIPLTRATGQKPQAAEPPVAPAMSMLARSADILAARARRSVAGDPLTLPEPARYWRQAATYLRAAHDLLDTHRNPTSAGARPTRGCWTTSGRKPPRSGHLPVCCAWSQGRGRCSRCARGRSTATLSATTFSIRYRSTLSPQR